jgi:hypothetical protein
VPEPSKAGASMSHSDRRKRRVTVVVDAGAMPRDADCCRVHYNVANTDINTFSRWPRHRHRLRCWGIGVLAFQSSPADTSAVFRVGERSCARRSQSKNRSRLMCIAATGGAARALVVHVVVFLCGAVSTVAPLDDQLCQSSRKNDGEKQKQTRTYTTYRSRLRFPSALPLSRTPCRLIPR